MNTNHFKVWTITSAAVIVATLLALISFAPGAWAQQSNSEQAPDRRSEQPATHDELGPPKLTQAAKEAPKERRKDEDPKGNPYTAGELIVTFKAGASEQAADAAVRGIGARTFQVFPDIDAQHLSFPEVKNERAQEARERKLERTKQKLEENPNVKAVDYNHIYEATAVPNDTRFGEQWGLTKINAPTAWDTAQGTGATVAVLDSGIDYNHPDVGAAVVAEYDYYNNDWLAEDNNGHGTHVAGTVAAFTNNNMGVAGGCPSCKLHVYKVLEHNPLDGRAYASGTSILNGVEAARFAGVDVINMSLGSYVANTAVLNEIDLAWSEGIVTVAATGNDREGFETDTGTEPYDGQVHYFFPAAHPTAVAVSATNSNDAPASFSNWGDWVDVAAPGDGILSTIPENSYDGVPTTGYGSMNGTSMATPHVSALAGLLASQGLTASEIRHTIETTSTDIGSPGKDVDFGHGQIDAEGAVEHSPTKKAISISGAIARDPFQVTGASFLSMPNGNPNAVSETPLSGFPRNGSSYGILTTGDASYAPLPNDSGGTGASLGGGNVRGNTDFDVSILKVDLAVPFYANCLSVDFKFLSEEFPEYVDSTYNDAFIAELDNSTWSTSSSAVNAPDNFVFIQETGKPMTINGVGQTATSAQSAGGTTYDGATKTLRASTPITPGAHSLYLSIFDQGDGEFDSAAFIDDLTLAAEPAGGCATGARLADPPPDTVIDSGPSGIVNGSASFGFHSSKPDSTFQCSLDGAAFTTCTSPKSYSGLKGGSHTFKVRAIDGGGIIDPTPATRTWTVDTTAPKGTIKINGGRAYATSPTVKLSLSASDPAPASGLSSMRFKNDGGSWSGWMSYATSKNWTLKKANGLRTVYVQYKDKAGNVSTTALDRIRLDTIDPRVVKISPTAGAKQISPFTNVKVTFSEAMKPATITKKSIILRRDFGKGKYQLVRATVTYDVKSKTATLNPSAKLAAGATYVATVFQSNRDLAGNQLDQYPGLAGDNGLFWRFQVKK